MTAIILEVEGGTPKQSVEDQSIIKSIIGSRRRWRSNPLPTANAKPLPFLPLENSSAPYTYYHLRIIHCKIFKDCIAHQT